jgi:hypothetical protein
MVNGTILYTQNTKRKFVLWQSLKASEIKDNTKFCSLTSEEKGRN